MILGLDRHPAAACFVELDDAVRALTDRVVVFNAHAFDAPSDAIVFNLEAVPEQADAERWTGHEVWDASARSCSAYASGARVTHVPLGYHASMTRFEMRPLAERDIDVLFCGLLNERRSEVLGKLSECGAHVVYTRWQYGDARNELMSRSRLVLNMRYGQSHLYPALRALHLVANGVPMLSESGPDMPAWAGGGVDYFDLPRAAVMRLNGRPGALEEEASARLRALSACPLVLP